MYGRFRERGHELGIHPDNEEREMGACSVKSMCGYERPRYFEKVPRLSRSKGSTTSPQHATAAKTSKTLPLQGFPKNSKKEGSRQGLQRASPELAYIHTSRGYGRPTNKAPPTSERGRYQTDQKPGLAFQDQQWVARRLIVQLGQETPHYLASSLTGEHREPDASQRPGRAEPPQKSALWLRAHDLREQAQHLFEQTHELIFTDVFGGILYSAGPGLNHVPAPKEPLMPPLARECLFRGSPACLPLE